MPDITTFTSEQLLDNITSYVAPAGTAYLNELKSRVIKLGDDDDDANHRGGVRPEHAPLIG